MTKIIPRVRVFCLCLFILSAAQLYGQAISGQNTGEQFNGAAPANLAFPASVTSGNQIVVAVHCYNSSTAPSINVPVKASGTALIGLFAQDGAASFSAANFYAVKIYRVPVTGSGSLALSFS